ncbi:Bacteroides conjugative transposon TraM protein [Mucilaginibacter gossypiicola]|uniref:Bacteroides conjugative transposon TraM protein n=1 Tax=Mucilaginibacter gossypiicola TaxID=551995 RepID=A0A1H8D4D3_9SPHI|nr:conjugative transposon protein TraM [Mucilaginibacter gossypiicola]SEN02170.1 Bacteroides conjugative transposon TraM protein [Mucilaginibacter gossypiicola]
MKINFKQPKYILPLVLLPFFCLFYYAWHSSFDKPKQDISPKVGLNPSVGNVSNDVRKRQLADKLDAFRNTYKQADGNSAVAVIPKEATSNPAYHNDYSEQQKRMLDSIAAKAKSREMEYGTMNRERQLARIINEKAAPGQRKSLPPDPHEKDPMEVFKQQMAVMDSITKANDPAYKAEKQKRDAAEKIAKEKASQIKFTVARAGQSSADFNTVLPENRQDFISAVIDENITGYAGSRLRLKLLEDIKAGDILIAKGTYLFAQISGFSEQRVTMSITSILYDSKILPVKLEVYDLDGMPGLYVPASSFREFTKDLGSNTVQGVTIDGSSNGSQFLMSTVDKVFQSTSSAIADLIRKNKAKLKYNSYIYLIDTDALQNAQKKY